MCQHSSRQQSSDENHFASGGREWKKMEKIQRGGVNGHCGGKDYHSAEQPMGSTGGFPVSRSFNRMSWAWGPPSLLL